MGPHRQRVYLKRTVEVEVNVEIIVDIEHTGRKGDWWNEPVPASGAVIHARVLSDNAEQVVGSQYRHGVTDDERNEAIQIATSRDFTDYLKHSDCCSCSLCEPDTNHYDDQDRPF